GTVYSESLFPRYHFGWSELYAATDARMRFIKAPRPELYDLGRDPGETENLAARQTATAAAMGDWLARLATPGDAAAPAEVSPEVREKLAALGYVGGGPPATANGTLPDPKDTIGSYQDL